MTWEQFNSLLLTYLFAVRTEQLGVLEVNFKQIVVLTFKRRNGICCI